MRDGLRKLRHAGTHLDSLSSLFPRAPFSACALFSSFLVFLPRVGYGGHRSPIATGGTSGEPQEEYLLLLEPPEFSSSSSRGKKKKKGSTKGSKLAFFIFLYIFKMIRRASFP